MYGRDKTIPEHLQADFQSDVENDEDDRIDTDYDYDYDDDPTGEIAFYERKQEMGFQG